MDSFGNSIEILADVFNTYTIGEPEGKGVNIDEALTKTSGEMSSQRLSEEPSPSSQIKPIELSRLDSEMDSDLPQSHESAESSESITSEKLDTDDADLPVLVRSNLESAEATEQENQTKTASGEGLQPSPVQENLSHSLAVDSVVTDSLPVFAEEHMNTSPKDAPSPQEVQSEPGAVRGVDQTAGCSSVGSKDSLDKRVNENSSIAALPVELPSRSRAQSLLDYACSLKDVAPGAPKTNEESKQPDKFADLKQNQDLSLPKPDAESEQVPHMDGPGHLSSEVSDNVSAYSSGLEGRVHGDEVCLPTEDESIDRSAKESGAENEDTEFTLQASGDDSDRLDVDTVISDKRDLRPVCIKEKSIHLDTDVCMASQDVRDVSISEGGVCSSELNLQVDNKGSDKHCSLLAEEDVLPDDELVIDDKRDDDLFERDIFPLEASMEACEKGLTSIEVEEQNIVCAGGAHSTKIVQAKDNDICLNGSDMTYISESEMIRLLEQDKDDITDDEPITTCQKDLENMGSSQKETELSNNKETRPSSSPVIWNRAQTTVNGTSELPASLATEVQNYQAKLKTTDHISLTSEIHVSNEVSTFPTAAEEKLNMDSCLPGSFLTIAEPRTEVIGPQNDLEQPEQGLSCGDQNYEPHGSSSGNQDVSPVGDSRTKHTLEEDSDVFVTVEDNDSDDSIVQKIVPLESSSLKETALEAVHLVSATVCSTKLAQTTTLECINENVPSPVQNKVSGPKPLSEPNKETLRNLEKILKEKNTLAAKEVENPPLDVLEYMPSTSHNDPHIKAASSERTGLTLHNQDTTVLKKKGKSIDQNEEEADICTWEQTTDLSLDQNDKSKENDLKRTLNNKLGELPTTNSDLGDLKDNSIMEENLEKQSVASPKMINEDKVPEVTRDDSSATKPVSKVISSVSKPVFQDSVEDSQLMDNDSQEDANSIETPNKAMGAGGLCLKCGRKLRRSRKELVWFPICFKCRKAAKKQERLSAHEMADDLDVSLEPFFCKSEESFSAEFSDSPVKHHVDDLQHVSDNSEGSAARKMYKCPKCDKAFRIPALLAGHIKCHTLPQCVSCGCQMQLKYKTKRIPRRCQKCVQQLKEKRAEKKLGEGSVYEDSGTEEDVADSLSNINSDDNVSDDDSRVAFQKAKRKPFKAEKPGSRDPIQQIDDDVLLLSESPESHTGKTLDEAGDNLKSKGTSKKQEINSFDELDTGDTNLVLSDGEKPRLCPQCGKAFPCNRSLNLHLLSHSGVQCESCGCRLPKRRRVGRWSRKCRSCRLQIKERLSNDGGDETDLPGNKLLKQKNTASLRLKAKQSKITKNTKIQSIIKKKKELKWMNMLLAVKGLMDKSRKKKENALKAADAAKKDGESSEAEKCDVSSADNTSILPDDPDIQTASSSKLPCPPDNVQSGSPKQVRKCLHREKNIIKVEENEVLPYIPTSAASISTAFIKKEESWQCLECNQNWPNSEALVNHQHSHISDQSFACSQCPQVFSSEQYLDIHIHAHDEERPFRCPECDKTFTKRNHLGVHMRVHTGSRPFACPDCPCRFRQKVTLIAHRYSHRNYQLLFAKPFQCSVCSKSFKQKERLVVHERLHTGECPFSCKDCNEVFPSKARLYVHRKMHKICETSSTEQVLSSNEDVGGQPFKCQDCGKVCSTKASFVLHRKVHSLSTISVKSIKREQSDEVHPFSCTECNKVFSSKATLAMHLKNHSAHKATAKSEMSLNFKQCFPCKHCDKVCFSKASLALHHKIHKSPSAGEQNLAIKIESETPSYICTDCNKVCSTKASFALHRKVHKTPTDAETSPFKCKDCDMVCTTKASFVLHRKVHRSLPSKPKPKGGAEPKSFNCKHCDMVFSTKASFVLHSKVHKSPSISEQSLKDDEELQSYNCKHCDMVFSTKASFILHSKVHRPLASEQALKLEEEPQLYSCKHCDMVCSTKASFALHSKVHRSLFGSEQCPKTSEETQSYGCKHCDMVCSTNASFALHSKVHRSLITEQSPKTPEEPQCFSCKECDMVCSSKASFVLHLKVPKSVQSLQADSKENTFKCKDCNKVFSTKASFILHLKVQKSSSTVGDGAEPPFHCKDCNKFFTSKGRLAAHRRLHDSSSSRDQNSDNESGAEQPKKTNEEKPFPCTICGLRFVKLKMLVRHKAVHGVRTVTPCMHCGKRFLYMKSLFNHIKTCQSKSKGKKNLKKAAVKRKIPKDGWSTSSDGESVQKKRRIDEKQKALTAAQKLKTKNQTVKAKKPGLGKEKGKSKAVSESKTKEKRTKLDSEVSSEGEGKKTASDKQNDGRPEKLSEQTAKEPTLKKVPKIKKVKKEPAKSKLQKVAGGGQKKWRVLAASTVKKKNLQAVLIGGKKKLLMKKKVQLKAKSGGKASKD